MLNGSPEMFWENVHTGIDQYVSEIFEDPRNVSCLKEMTQSQITGAFAVGALLGIMARPLLNKIFRR